MWFANVEAKLPSDKFPAPTPTDSEECFGKLTFGADWVGKLTSDDLRVLSYLRPRWHGWVDVSGERIDPHRTKWSYEGPEEFRLVADKVKERAARGNEQLAYIRQGLALLKRFGPGNAPPLGTPYQYALDPLDPVAEIDPKDRELLIEFRQYYWRIRGDAVAPAAPLKPSIRSETKRRPIPASAPKGRVVQAAYYAIRQRWGADGGPPVTMSYEDIANAIKINCSRETIRRALTQRG
jgi:hypothetical protein